MLGVVHVAPGTFFAIIAASALAAAIATVAGGRGLVAAPARVSWRGEPTLDTPASGGEYWRVATASQEH